MLQALVRRAAILVIILALVASVQIRVIPMAMGSSAADMAGMASENGAGACKICLPGISAWPWSSDPTRTHSCAPDTAPPRP